MTRMTRIKNGAIVRVNPRLSLCSLWLIVLGDRKCGMLPDVPPATQPTRNQTPDDVVGTFGVRHSAISNSLQIV
jgi:hypothetical protein